MKETDTLQIPLPSSGKTDRIDITFYTDPLCCWSWAFEPQWRKFQYEFRDQIHVQYRMGGLLADWKSFSDPMNSVSRPVQMGPVWMEARHISGMSINDAVWMSDPPSSSYPACIAVKTAGLQSEAATNAYLRNIREAIMLHGRNISRNEVLVEAAEQTEKQIPSLFNAALFINDFNAGKGLDAFREDLKQVRLHQISRFPTLTMSVNHQPGVMITGFRPYNVLLEAALSLKPDLPQTTPIEPEAYDRYWGSLTERERAEICIKF